MKKIMHYTGALLPVLAGMVAVGLLTQRENGESAAPSGETRTVLDLVSPAQSSDDSLHRAIRALQSQLEEMVRNEGGRYHFVVIKDRFLRLDTHEGKIAFFDDVSEASWNTLRMKEQEIGPNSGYYRNYVNFLRTLPQP